MKPFLRQIIPKIILLAFFYATIAVGAIASPASAPSFSSNTTTSISPSPFVAPTPSPTTNVTPSTAAPTSSPAQHKHHEWWLNVRRVIIETGLWLFIIGISALAFSAIMSNRYRIYFYLRGSLYTFLHKIKSLRRSKDSTTASSSLDEIIFSDDGLQEALLMRET